MTAVQNEPAAMKYVVSVLIAVFVMVRRQHKRHLPHHGAEEC